ncbi:hypothetical protein AB0F93_00050 [Micromonospora tulbaghiae]|uniref:Gp37-like protein n=1 Tax=Micromonospora tulbaghiae TaxID=479978 RepID=UPI00332DC4CE
MTYRVGATPPRNAFAYWEPKVPINQWIRIFPERDGQLSRWDDFRFDYCRRVGAIPFVSTKIDGDATKLATLRQRLINMPSWIHTIYCTDRHEPEGDLPVASYRTNFNRFADMIDSLPAATRVKVRYGPVLTRQWTENTPGRSYAIHDTGRGDFLGVDMYANAYGSDGNAATSYPSPAAFVAGLKAYRHSPTDVRPRVVPEMGAVGLPFDTDGTYRAAWLQGVADQFDSWNTTSGTPWRFDGFIWWNMDWDGAHVPGLGTLRCFQLDHRHTGTGSNANPYTYALLPGNPPAPLAVFNDIAADHYTTAPPPGNPEDPPPPVEEPPDPVDPPIEPPPPPPPSSLPTSGPASARLLHASYTVLVTDPLCQVLGDPLDGWTSMQITKRWKEPGSGQLTIPAYRYIREQLQPGCRIVVLRRLFGQQHILMSGPVEDILRERADDGEKGGVGVLTVTFVEDLAWLGARLAIPDPTKFLEQQTHDYWTYSGNPELGMLQLVNTQAGPEALLGRRVPRLVVAPFSGITDTGTVKLGPTSDVAPRERLEKLTDVLRRMATLGNGPGQPEDSLGFRTRQVFDQILFEVVRSRDLTGEAHFSFGKGNLKYYSFQQTAPKLTHAAVGGQAAADEGAARLVRQFVTTDPAQTAWGRFEGYLPRPGTDPLADMQAAADEAFRDGGQTARLAVSAADTVDQRYGIHYDVGDLVSVELDIGEHVIAPVQTVALQVYPTAGEVAGVTIGDQSARYDSKWIKKQREMDRRIGYLERRALTR